MVLIGMVVLTVRNAKALLGGGSDAFPPGLANEPPGTTESTDIFEVTVGVSIGAKSREGTPFV